MIRLGVGGIGTTISNFEKRLDPIGAYSFRFLYGCGHFAPDHLSQVEGSTRSGQIKCVLCLGKRFA